MKAHNISAARRLTKAGLTRRLLPTIVVLALGFTVLLAGLIGLWRVFHSERSQARQVLAQQRQTLEHYARQTLEQRLDRDLRAAAAEIEEALVDPLLPADHLLSVEAGRQLLPRVVSPVPGIATPGADLYRALLDERSDVALLAGNDRRSPHREALDALALSDEGAIERTFRALLRHRARFRIAPEHDLPAMLAVLKALQRESRPAPELLQALLVDGLDDGQGGRLESLSRLLLAHRNRFTTQDFRFLSERLIELSTLANVPYEAFLERSREAGEAVLIPKPTPLLTRSEGGPIELLHAGRWLIRRQTGQHHGLRVELAEALDEATEEMRSRGLLDSADGIRTSQPTLADHLPFDELRLTVDSDRWTRQATQIEARYRLKAGLVLLSATLAAAMAFLTVAFQARRLRLVELKSEFVAAVSHELRTPLASVRLMAETVDRRATAPELKDYPARIVREIDRLSFLVENILSFNRLEGGRVEPNLTRVPLDELILSVRETLKTQVERTVLIEGPESDAILRVDRELMKLLFLNLARNAALYNDRDPVILKFEHRSGHEESCQILIHDNGRGIADRDRERIFGQFFRASVTSPSTGTGLGLAICRRVAELHRGKIEVATSSHEGTTFRLELPTES